MATPSREISASPRVTRAALVLSPKPSPSRIPAAIAIEFLSDVAISTPTTSSLVYTRKYGRTNASRTSAHAAASLPAATIEVGTRRLTSSAWLGPTKLTMRPTSTRNSSRNTSLIRASVPSSRPLVAHTTSASGSKVLAARTRLAVARVACDGTTNKTKHASRSDAARSFVTTTFAGIATPGRNFLFSLSRATSAASEASNSHNATSWPFSAKTMARLVPQLPAPNTATRIATPSGAPAPAPSRPASAGYYPCASR